MKFNEDARRLRQTPEGKRILRDMFKVAHQTDMDKEEFRGHLAERCVTLDYKFPMSAKVGALVGGALGVSAPIMAYCAQPEGQGNLVATLAGCAFVGALAALGGAGLGSFALRDLIGYNMPSRPYGEALCEAYRNESSSKSK